MGVLSILPFLDRFCGVSASFEHMGWRRETGLPVALDIEKSIFGVAFSSRICERLLHGSGSPGCPTQEQSIQSYFVDFSLVVEECCATRGKNMSRHGKWPQSLPDDRSMPGTK